MHERKCERKCNERPRDVESCLGDDGAVQRQQRNGTEYARAMVRPRERVCASSHNKTKNKRTRTAGQRRMHERDNLGGCIQRAHEKNDHKAVQVQRRHVEHVREKLACASRLAHLDGYSERRKRTWHDTIRVHFFYVCFFVGASKKAQTKKMRLLLLLVFVSVSMGSCPWNKFRPLGNNEFSLGEYISKPWHVQMQLPVSYQPADRLFCVRARYTADDDGIGVNVFNECRVGSVTGRACVDKDYQLCAVRDRFMQSKLMVGPCWLPSVFYGPYWVVGQAADKSWATVSGGEPTDEVEQDGQMRCTTSSGTWIFTREQTPPQRVIDDALHHLMHIGVATDKLVRVAQEGCIYS